MIGTINLFIYYLLPPFIKKICMYPSYFNKFSICLGRQLLSGLSICLLFIVKMCSYLDSTSVSSDFKLPGGNDSIYQFTKRFFLLFPGDTALLYGTRVCTTISYNDTNEFHHNKKIFRRYRKKIKESLVLERGPEGAKIYNDWDIPDSINSQF